MQGTACSVSAFYGAVALNLNQGQLVKLNGGYQHDTKWKDLT